MKSYSLASAAATAFAGAALLVSSVKADVDPIVIKGSHFFYKTNGTEFFIKGIAYQQEAAANGTASTSIDFTDPLADEASCARDVPLLAELGTNVVRVYAIDPTKDHKKCMTLLEEAGIYVIQDLSNPQNSIIRDQPEWTTSIFAGYAAVIDEMAQFTNTLGFFAGNEVSNQANNTDASAFVKASVRDSKAYIKAKGYRAIGVGYATNDDAEIRDDLADYFNCGKAEESIDFWGYNIYSWCGKSTFQKSGYDVRTKEFETYNVPAFFAEYGCNEPSPRVFTEVEAIYGPQMTGVWSGGIVYMYFQEANNYGLVQVKDNAVSKLADFKVLASQVAKVSPSGVSMASYTPTNTAARTCPSVNAGWAASSTLPPAANSQVCDCMVKSLSCKAKSGMKGKDIATQFDYVCGNDAAACAGINANATTGKYGAYSMCTSEQKLSFAFDQYYQSQGSKATACDFSGTAEIQAGSTASECTTLLAAAGKDGSGTVGSVGTSTGGSASETSTNAAAGSMVPRFEMGALSMGSNNMARRAIVIEDSEDELPELATIFKAKELKTIGDGAKKTESKKGTMRRRVLNGVSDNPLLRPLGREVGREKEGRVKGKGKAASSALVSASVSGGVGVSVVEPAKEEEIQRRARKTGRTALGDQKKAEILECLESLSDSFDKGVDRIEKGMDMIEGINKEIKMPRGTGKAAVEQAPDDGVEVGKVLEDLEGLQLEEEADASKPRPRRGRVVKPVAAVQAETEEEDDDSPVVDTRPRRARTAKPAAIVRPETPVEDDSLVEDEEDDMSDFIVSDDSSVEEFEEEEDDLSPVPAPKSVRKLVRGRRPDTSSQSEAPKVEEAQDLHLDWSDDDTKEESVVPRPVTRRLFPTQKDEDTTGNSEEECPILTYDPPTSKASRKPAKKTIFTTPPPSPKKTLVSPKKAPRIPTATHSPSTDDFWKADVVNDWNDEFSPQKPLRSLNLVPAPEDLTGSPRKAPAAKKDKALIERKKKFNENKHAIALSFLRELDSEITDGKVSALAASTGGISIIWSKKLNTTAGRANWKREAIRSRPLSPNLPPTTTYRHHASIELAEKVIDDEDRLLNVVAHEFCHLANFMVSGVTNNPHGKEFKAWASRCSARFGGRGIEVTTKHSYEIAFNCGLCKGRLVQTRPVPRAGAGEGVEKVMGEYQAYVKENIGRVRKENAGSPQKDIMALVGRGYRELKAERLKGLGRSGLSVESVVEEDSVDLIVKKIDFLDLTTP
ncbi:hypothetical protein V499_04307 [Pseudogymnoascus sp. VKM F-103]|nr:hypothetical protein V499_04307 [Pseudogymnoascus sp. VKM F-103]